LRIVALLGLFVDWPSHAKRGGSPRGGSLFGLEVRVSRREVA